MCHCSFIRHTETETNSNITPHHSLEKGSHSEEARSYALNLFSTQFHRKPVFTVFTLQVLDVTEPLLNSHWWPHRASEVGTSTPKEAFTTSPNKRHLQHLTRQLYSTSVASQVVLASLTLSQYYRQISKDLTCFPP